MYQQAIREIEAKAAKVRRRDIARAAAGVGAVVGLMGGLAILFTLRLPDPETRRGAFLYVAASCMVGPPLLVGAFFYACAVVAQTAWRAVVFVVSRARQLCKPRAGIRDMAER